MSLSGSSVNVSVVLPHYDQHDALYRTLAVLGYQTYPSSNLQVVVADDGSAQPIDRNGVGHVDYDLVLVAQEHNGFGLARARNLGAQTADGDIVVFLDADMLPEPGLVAAHVRAIAPADYWVSIGHRRHIDPGDLDMSEIHRTLGLRRSLSAAFDGRTQSEPGWRADFVYRAEGLRSERSEAYRIASGGNLAVWRNFYHEVGGSDEGFRQWGGEDIEWAFRATQYGARFTYTEQALAWHQGLPDLTDAGERKSQAEQRPLLANRIADRHLRPLVGNRLFTVPHLSIAVEVAEATVPQVEAFVDGVLAHPLGATVSLAGAGPEQRMLLARAYQSDPRVSLGKEQQGTGAVISPSPIVVRVDLSEPVSPDSVLMAADRIERPPYVSVITVGAATSVMRRQHAARVIREGRGLLSDTQVVDRVANLYGADTLQPQSVPGFRPPAAAVEGADVLRQLWWRMSPKQRSLIEAIARRVANWRLQR